MFEGSHDARITELTEDFHKSREGLTQQVETVDKKVGELGTRIDKIDVKFEELKQLVIGFQNQGSSLVKLESDAAQKEDTESSSTGMEEVSHFNFVRHFMNNGNNKFESVQEIALAKSLILLLVLFLLWLFLL